MKLQPASVLIAAYNEAATLPTPFDYLLINEADCVNEILVCANGCTDGTPEIVLEYGRRDARVRLLHSEKGKPHAWNTLVQAARNEIVIFLDADVEPQPGAIRRLLEAFRPETVIVAGMDQPVADWRRPGSKLLSYLTRPREDDYLNGRFYGARRTALLERIERETGSRRLPIDLLHEDSWLQVIVQSHELVVAKNACVHYHPGSWTDYPSLAARHRLANMQILERSPAAYQRWRKARQSPALTLKEKILKAYRLGGAQEVFALTADKTLRWIVRRAYSSRIQQRYDVMSKRFALEGGSEVLAGVGRIESTKVARLQELARGD
jgi:glycosyltransferase involved in cell wall biosynthesis